jgi:hypothetical protein
MDLSKYLPFCIHLKLEMTETERVTSLNVNNGRTGSFPRRGFWGEICVYIKNNFLKINNINKKIFKNTITTLSS